METPGKGNSDRGSTNSDNTPEARPNDGPPNSSSASTGQTPPTSTPPSPAPSSPLLPSPSPPLSPSASSSFASAAHPHISSTPASPSIASRRGRPPSGSVWSSSATNVPTRSWRKSSIQTQMLHSRHLAAAASASVTGSGTAGGAATPAIGTSNAAAAGLSRRGSIPYQGEGADRPLLGSVSHDPIGSTGGEGGAGGVGTRTSRASNYGSMESRLPIHEHHPGAYPPFGEHDAIPAMMMRTGFTPPMSGSTTELPRMVGTSYYYPQHMTQSLNMSMGSFVPPQNFTMSPEARSLLSASLSLLTPDEGDVGGFSKNTSVRPATDATVGVYQSGASQPQSLSSSNVSMAYSETPGGPMSASAQIRYENDALPFLMSLCAALHKFGAPAHRIEYNMFRASQGLNVEASFAVLPTLIIVSFGPEGERRQETHLFRASQGLNCYKLFLVDDLTNKVANQEIELSPAIKELHGILETGPLYPSWMKIICFGVCSGSVASVFFKGGIVDMAVSFLLGLMVGCLSVLGTKNADFERLCEAVSAILAAALATLFVEYIHPACFGALTLSAIIWLLPGLSITMAVAELVTKNMLAGTARIFYAMLVALELGFGMAIGTLAIFWVDRDKLLTNDICEPMPSYIRFGLFFIVSITFNMLFGAHPNQWAMMSTTSLVSYSLSQFSAMAGFRPELGTVLAAGGVGIAGNIYARFSGHSSIIPVLSGIVMLVPGSIGVRGVKAFMDDDVVSGIAFGFSMLVIALSIIVGLFLANIVIPPRRLPRPRLANAAAASVP